MPQKQRDITQQLRNHLNHCKPNKQCVRCKAATEIENLRTQINNLNNTKTFWEQTATTLADQNLKLQNQTLHWRAIQIIKTIRNFYLK